MARIVANASRISDRERTPWLLTFGNNGDRLRLMRKTRFGDLLHAARQKKGYSLRDLAERTEMNYSRLSRIEHGTRPAPGLPEIRLLADSLDVDMSDLLVSSGTPREVMEHLLWSERLQAGRPRDRRTALPEWSLLLEKNTYRVRIARRDGALCTVAFGNAKLDVLHFDRSREISVSIPPEAVLVFRDRPDPESCSAENVLPVRLKKLRRLGQVTNLVLAGDGFELNALHTDRSVNRLGLTEGDPAFAAIHVTAIRT
jgi:transcriptional regulator with XRE-family HTH domain/molybdopterin-binding protein